VGGNEPAGDAREGPVTIKGIDVSGYQTTDYPLDGYDFVIVKATEGTSYVNPRHNEQIDRARANNRVVGHYHYLSPSSGISDQMDYFLDHIAAHKDEFLAVDWEDTGVSNSEKDDAIRRLQDKAGGRKVLLYCNVDFWLNRDTTSFAGDGLWIAHYNGDPGNPGIEHDWLIHQYTSDPIDTNIARFDSRDDMRAWAKGSGGEEEDEDEPPRRSLYDAHDLTRTVRTGAWTTLLFNRRYEDGDWVGKDDQNGIVYGPCYYTASVGVRVKGLPSGGEVRLRLANYQEKGGGGFERTVAMPSQSPVHVAGDLHVVHTWTGFVPGADRGRVFAEVRYDGESSDPVTIDYARAETLYWPA
jgi:hypothetical protein